MEREEGKEASIDRQRFAGRNQPAGEAHGAKGLDNPVQEGASKPFTSEPNADHFEAPQVPERLHAHVLGEHGKVFAEVETIAQLGDGGLPKADFRRLCRNAQPTCEGVFAVAAASQVQAFVKAADAEYVEVACVGVGLVEVAVA